MTSINDVLKASKGLPVDDIFAELWGRKLAGDYTIDVYTGTLPAVLAGTKAGYLHRYKIYGNTEQAGTPTPENPITPSECGEKTANLFDGTLLEGVWTSKDLNYRNALGNVYRSMKLRLEAGTYSIVFSEDIYMVRKIINGVYSEPNIIMSFMTFTVQTQSDVGFSFRMPASSSTPWDDSVLISVNEGSTPLPYEPYGYKLPLTSGSTPVDIYIGDDTLSAEEYVDSGTGKIYRMVGGVLTPVDPPVPFPQIPTTANSTTISWAGSGLAPSEVELTYERK